MSEKECHRNRSKGKLDDPPLAFSACPNHDHADFNHFGTGSLSTAGWMGRGKAIRRLYCKTFEKRFGDRQGALMKGTRLAQTGVVSLVKSRDHTCSIEATADMCEVDTGTVLQFQQKAGERGADFHCLQPDNVD